ncbi:SRPBCC domain-containing protein [Sphingomonas psychrotolerans]|uniref:SRPBCC domain-containing protein n=1 Tax=Sphingomonas psychrotolerans TaxID=1327635 RepID=A0ABU3N3L6_9SPHN|nr:SRPBCC domain-containing protein [Sphingomonas psychrotolerans]MDT8757865.1 SRPBCC domain-containing protein [Sphingomonas psychrotolerans]
MTQPLTHSKFILERRYPRPVETVFAALADPDKRRRWYAESNQHEILEYEAEFRPGGVDRLTYRFTGDAPIKGATIANEGRFENIQDNASVVTSSSMWLGEHCISAALVTIELFPESEGTRLVCTHQAVFFPGADGPELREQGWNVLLDKLGKLLG